METLGLVWDPVTHRKVTVALPEFRHLQLARTCFRGRRRPLAGNFLQYRSLRTLLSEPELQEPFIDDCLMVIREFETGAFRARHQFTLQHAAFPIGWSNTEDRNLFRAEDLEEVNFNGKKSCKMLKVKRDVPMRAPLTSVCTIAAEVRNTATDWLVLIEDIFLGRPFGEYRGNVSAREGVVFFDKNHPGVPIDAPVRSAA